MEETTRQLAGIRQTLLMNFGPGNLHGRNPLIKDEGATSVMLVTVFEHLLQWRDRCLAAERMIKVREQGDTDLNNEAEMAWKTIKHNQELKKTFRYEDSDNRPPAQ